MALNIRNAEAEKLAAAVASLTGETKTEAVTRALRERLETLTSLQDRRELAAELVAIGKHCASLPVVDHRSDDEILGYDRDGMPE